MFRPLRWILLALALLVLSAPWSAPALMRRRADNPVWRGMRLAEANGCFACHRAPHNGELANPGSPFGTVPSLAGSNLAMYVEGPSGVEEWIRNGYTRALREDEDAWATYRSQLIQMPPFSGRLEDDEIAALRAFVLAADGYFAPSEEPARTGAELATKHCLSCHNVGGAGGLPNPGSPFGYIPGLWGKDFDDLVRSDDELREWIKTGSSERVASLPLATWFAGRQQIAMPAFGDHLDDDEVAALVAYVRWLGATEGGTREIAGR